jgi:hypothetical protein
MDAAISVQVLSVQILHTTKNKTIYYYGQFKFSRNYLSKTFKSYGN